VKVNKFFDIRNAALKRTLSREDEQAIFARLDDLRGRENPTPKEEGEIAQIVDYIVKANIKFVVMVANNYERKRALPMEDLIAEGLIGLLQAIYRFDIKTGNKFVSYLVWWVRNGIYYALVKDKGTSAHFYNKTSIIGKKIDKIEQSIGKKAHLSSIFEDLNLSHVEVMAYEGVSSDILSIDNLQDEYEEAGSGLWSQVMEDHEAESPEDVLDDQIMKDALEGALDELGHREAYIVRAMTGLLGNKPMSFKDVGIDIGLTHERTRQIYKDGIAKLSNNPLLRELTLN
jgi:RNA polymerase primary sigma factor